MAGRRLIDLSALLHASSRVAQQHMTIRRRQWAIFAATTSLKPNSRRVSPIHQTNTKITPKKEPGEYIYDAKKQTGFQPEEMDPSPHPEAGQKLDEVLPEDEEATGTRRPAKEEMEVHETRDQPETELNKGRNASEFYERPGKKVEDKSKPIPEAVTQDKPLSKLNAGRNAPEFYEMPSKTVGVHLAEETIPKSVDRSSTTSIDGIPDEVSNEKNGKVNSEGVDMDRIEGQLFHSRRAKGLLSGRFRTVKASPLPSTPSASTPASSEPLEALVNEETEKILGHDIPEPEIKKLAEDISREMKNAEGAVPELKPAAAPYELNPSKVPSSRLSRIFHYGGLAAGMAWGAAAESVRRAAGGGGDNSTGVMFNEANVERLVKKLSRMRGAALKLGQMMSIQDSNMLPPALQTVLVRVQDSADYMPASQRDSVLAANLGSDWRSLFSEFTEIPMAAASIGQVHRGVLASNNQPVAIKVQYPGVASSISSDLSNLGLLLTASKLLPKGLYLDKTIANARTELAWECDYIREADAAKRFSMLLAGEADTFRVPRIIEQASGAQVLTMELMFGTAVTKMIPELTQEDRDFIGTAILGLCLREVAIYRFMQTDPNWTNFLYNPRDKKIELLDFGASREYPEEFVQLYTSLLKAAAEGDREAVETLSVKLGYLTGMETKQMTQAHIDSILTLAEPFSKDAPELYDFEKQTVTDRVRAQIPLMIRERLTPPPEETYSLHRKLSGAFLLCARLRSRVPCRKIFREALGDGYEV